MCVVINGIVLTGREAKDPECVGAATAAPAEGRE